jgi:hypothetical protein
MSAKRGRRGQVTLFVIVAIIIIAGIAIFVATRQGIIKPAVSAEEAQKIVSSQIQPIRDRIEECAKGMARSSINTMGWYGGYAAVLPERALTGASEALPGAPDLTSYSQFYDTERSSYEMFLPSLERMKGEFALLFREDNLRFQECINDFEEFRKLVDIKAGNLNINTSEVDFGEKSGKMVIPFTYPITVSKGEAKTVIDNYNVIIPINMEKIHDLVASILNKISANEDYILFLNSKSRQQQDDLEANPKIDTMFVDCQLFNTIKTGEIGKSINSINRICRLDYNNNAEGLSPAYKFYFLAGSET